MRIKENVKEWGLYAAPEISVVEMYAEGVLCQSGQDGSGSFGDLEDGGNIF